jgi:hypothetical protein
MIAQIQLSIFCLVFLLLSIGTVRADAPRIAAKVTFTEHVAPIVFKNCTSCHRPGEGAPFSLMTYQEVKKRGNLISQVTGSGYMPPWPPAKGGPHFQDERRLSDDQIETLADWVDAGMPEGPKDKLPDLPKFPKDGWQLGKPDLVVTLPEAFDVPADGRDIYRMFVLPLNLPEDQWVTAVEIHPTARTVVHHALYFLDSSGACRTLDEADPGPGFSRMGFPRTGSLGGWAVGATTRNLPGGLAFPLPKGSDLVVQIHFHPSGKAEREQTSFGLYFAKQPPKKKLLGRQLPYLFGMGTKLMTEGIKPGDKHFTIQGRWVVPFDIEVVTVGAHAHYLCTSLKAVATLPDGHEQNLLAIYDWDFNWQGRYSYASPVFLPKGTVVESTLTYDNSTDNPRNPLNPAIKVEWGEETTDEMGSIMLAFVAKNEADLARYSGPPLFFEAPVGLPGAGAGQRAGNGAAAGGLALMQLTQVLKDADKNKNGMLEWEELPPRLKTIAGALDTNGDGVLDPAEVRNLVPVLTGLRRMRQRRDAPVAKPSENTSKPTPCIGPEAQPEPDRGPALNDLNGRVWHPLSPERGAKANVLVFVTQDCPVANQFSPEISRLAREFASRDVSFLLVQVDPSLTPDEARAHSREFKLDQLPVFLDPKHILVRATGVKVTPEAALITPDGKVVYHGRIDDRFRKLGRQVPEPSHRDLRDAVEAVLAGKPVLAPTGPAVGCPIGDFE